MSPGTVMTPSEMACLIGLKVVPEDRLAAPPLSEAAAALRQGEAKLSAKIIAEAVVALEAEGAAKLAFVEKKKLRVFNSRHVVLTPAEKTAFPDGSLEAKMRAIVGGSSEMNVYDLVRRVLSRDSPNPSRALRAIPFHRLVALGVVTQEEIDAKRGVVGSILNGKTTTENALDIAVFDRSRDELEAFARRLSSGHELAGKIEHEAQGAMTSRVERDNDLND